MEGPQELIPSNEGLKIKTTVKPQPEQVVEHKTGFSSKLIAIRANAREYAQKATLLFVVRISETEAQYPVEKIFPEDALCDIGQKIEELDRAKGLRRMPAALKKRRLEAQKNGIQRQIKQDELLLADTSQIIQTVRDNYEQLLNEILEEGTITREIRESYIQQVIAPEVDKIIEDRQLPEDKREAFYFALRTYIDHRDEPDTQRQPYRQELDSLFTYEAGFGSVEDDCEPLLNGGDRKMVQQLVVKLAAEDIAPIKDVAESHFNVLGMGWKFRETIEKVTGRWNQSFGGDIFGKLTHKDKSIPSWCKFSFQRALKSSRAAMETFGELIERQDREYYEALLADSLVDHPHHHSSLVDLIEYYPTLEAVRNLVLMASKRYTFEELSTSFRNLFEKKEHEAILDSVEAKYPSFQRVRPLVERWTSESSFVHPEMQDDAYEFAQEVLDKELGDTRLIELCHEVQSCSAKHTLDVLHNTGQISDQEFTSLNTTLKFLRSRTGKVDAARHDEFFFRDFIFERSSVLFQPDADISQKDIQLMAIKKLAMVAQRINENQNNQQLLDNDFLGKVAESGISPEDIVIIMKAFEEIPPLTKDRTLAGKFLDQYRGKETVRFFNDISIAYADREQQLLQIVGLVGKSSLTKERALELPTKVGDILNSLSFSTAVEFPAVFLKTDEGLTFLRKITKDGLSSWDASLDLAVGQQVFMLQKDKQFNFRLFIQKISTDELARVGAILAENPKLEISEENWRSLMMVFVRSRVNVWGLPALSKASASTIKNLFDDTRAKDLCLNSLNKEWLTYLRGGKPEQMPFTLYFTTEFIEYCGGAGPLSQIESLSSLINSVNKAFSRETTVERTKAEIYQGLMVMEEKFTREKWSNEDKTDFYNISRDILGAAPSIFSDCLSLFGKLSPLQMRQFAKEIYPLYRIKFVLMEKEDDKGNKTYDRQQLIQLRTGIRDFASALNEEGNPFETQKQRLLEEIRGLFKDRFGIIKIPENFTSEHMRSFANVLTYLANLHARTPEKENVLGFYLSLMINDRWDDFRRGEEINPDEYLISEKSGTIRTFLGERQRLNPLTPDNLGIPPEQLPEFFKLLQQETQNVVIGNIETIDVKLTNIILNLRGLEDPDLYPDLLDKQRMQLLLNWGNKKVGSVTAKLYQKSANPERSIQFLEEDTKIQEQITQIIRDRGLTFGPQTLKEHFQDGIKPLATVVNLLSFVGETGAEPEVESLRRLLEPSNEVVEIFRRLGEDFKPTSGAMALSQDLSYLDNLVVKREDELKPEEKVLLTEYTSGIRTQIIRLESIYGQIKNKFGGLKQGRAGSRNPLLQDKLAQIDSIINTQATQQAITSTVTNNLNTIIENIRECLSCTREGSNNDTNLTFGDMNKFYLYSQTETQERGSISDELVFVEPITRADGSQGIAFVLDRIYGANTPTILENQVEAVLKKYRVIKQRFPDIRLAVFVSDAAISTGGISTDMFMERLSSKNISVEKEAVKVSVAESPAGNHYIEFGGAASRSAEKRQVNGVVLSI